MRLTLERLFSDPPITGRPLVSAAWRPGHAALTYLEKGDGDSAEELWSLDPGSGERTLLGTGDALGSLGGRKKKVLSGYRWSPDGRALLLSQKKALWRWELAGAPVLLLADHDPQVPPQFSPDGSRLCFVRRGNLWLREIASGSERPLTTDGSATRLHGKLDWAYWEELGHRRTWRAFEWSPDGTRVAWICLDQSRVPTYPLVDVMAVHPRLTRQRYPKAGDPNAVPSVWMAAVDGAEPACCFRSADDSVYIGPDLAWQPDSRAFTFTRMPRDQRRLELCRVSVETAQSETLLTEEDPHWINQIGPPRFLPDGDFLWASERTGRAHLHRVSPGGGTQTPLTSGNWQVEAFHGADEQHAYVTGAPEDARERHLYRVPLTGGEVQRLTPDGGVNFTDRRPEGGWSLVTAHTPNAPASTILIRDDGSPGLVVRTPDPGWDEFSWGSADFIDVTAPDGTRLHGRLLKPDDFDPARRYPVVVHVYGGPHAQVVRKTWSGDDALEQLLLQEGILVWRLDNRGSWGRGHAFETPVDRHLGELELADQLAGVEFLRSLPYVDGDRIGITGWSYGGYLTLFALTHAPKAWRCGIAGAPVTDWKLYDSIYTERYMGTPAQNPEGYRNASPLETAGALEAPLLLVHGTDDDNVHLQNTLQFVEALSRHRKPYELLVQPRQTHGFAGKEPRLYLHERMVEFFVRHLSPSTHPSKAKR